MISIFLAGILAAQATPRTAREYYNEIYAAGGLDRMADEYVCFDEDTTLEYFFIFAKSGDMRDVMIWDGTFEKLSKKMQTELKQKEWLSVHGYAKGIPFNGEEFYQKDGGSWLSGVYDLDPKNSTRSRLTINWATLRYKRSVELLDHQLHFKSELSRFGKCEEVSPKVPQSANPE
jgi:hypothetical protein